MLDKWEFKCKSRGMETCLHFRGAALNARETGIYLSFLDGTEEPNISNKPTIILPKSIPPVEIRTSLQIKGLPNRNLNNGKVIMTPMA